jgi:hypothetical protein
VEEAGRDLRARELGTAKVIGKTLDDFPETYFSSTPLSRAGKILAA